MKIRVFTLILISFITIFSSYSKAWSPIANDSPIYYYEAMNKKIAISNREYSNFLLLNEGCRKDSEEAVCFYDDFKFSIKLYKENPIFFKIYLSNSEKDLGFDINNGEKVLINFLNYNDIDFNVNEVVNYLEKINRKVSNGGNFDNDIMRLKNNVVIRFYDNREYGLGGDYIYILSVYKEK